MTGITSKPLRGLIRGDVLDPGTPGYDTARRGWNGTIDRRPALIARCLDAADVAHALRYATGEGLAVTVRGGGHNVAGTAVADGALMIDLSRMRSVAVDPAARLAVAGGGALLADVDAATTPHGLACPSGVVSETGLGGLALGGGYGWLARKWGLTCDHIVAAEVVLVDGSIVEVSERNRPDLLWGLRGGGGNFGVVTRFTLRLRPVSDVWFGAAVFPLEQAAAALRGYRAFAPRQPRDLQVVGALKYASPAPWVPAALHGRPVLSMSAIWLGDPAEGAAAVAGLFGDPGAAATTGGVRSFAQVQASADGAEPAGRRYFTKSCYLSDLPDPAIDVLLAATADNPSPHSVIDLGHLLGAITDAGTESSAFPVRDAPYICSASAAWTDPALDATAAGWSRALVAALAPWRSGGSYLNYTTPASPEATAARYGPGVYARLARLKAEFDPANVLRSNHNVTPA